LCINDKKPRRKIEIQGWGQKKQTSTKTVTIFSSGDVVRTGTTMGATAEEDSKK